MVKYINRACARHNVLSGRSGFCVWLCILARGEAIPLHKGRAHWKAAAARRERAKQVRNNQYPFFSLSNIFEIGSEDDKYEIRSVPAQLQTQTKWHPACSKAVAARQTKYCCLRLLCCKIHRARRAPCGKQLCERMCMCVPKITNISSRTIPTPSFGFG